MQTELISNSDASLVRCSIINSHTWSCIGAISRGCNWLSDDDKVDPSQSTLRFYYRL